MLIYQKRLILILTNYLDDFRGPASTTSQVQNQKSAFFCDTPKFPGQTPYIECNYSSSWNLALSWIDNNTFNLKCPHLFLNVTYAVLVLSLYRYSSFYTIYYDVSTVGDTHLLLWNRLIICIKNGKLEKNSYCYGVGMN